MQHLLRSRKPDKSGYICYELGRRALGRRVYPHLLRHSAITRMLADGMNAYQVRAVAGNFTALDAYAHLTAEDAYDAMMRRAK